MRHGQKQDNDVEHHVQHAGDLKGEHLIATVTASDRRVPVEGKGLALEQRAQDCAEPEEKDESTRHSSPKDEVPHRENPTIQQQDRDLGQAHGGCPQDLIGDGHLVFPVDISIRHFWGDQNRLHTLV